MAWNTLSLHFQQTYEGGFRYLDKCGEFMLAATERMNFIMSEAKPTGAKMEIPEMGVHAACDTLSLAVAQELPVDDGAYFLGLCKGLAELVMSCFGPKSVFKNGLLWKSYTPSPNISDMLGASLKYGGAFHEDLARAVGMVPENKNLDYFFVSGSKDLHVVLQPVTFERLNLPRRNVGARATRAHLDTAPIMGGVKGSSSGRNDNLNQRKRMKTEQTRPWSLREIEMEVEAEGREWTRQRLQQRLQEEADRQGGVFPPQRPGGGASAQPSDADAHRRWGG